MITQFIGNIYSTLETGHIFIIGGRTIDGATRLDVNFAAGKHDDVDIPLQISVKFHEDIIVRNSRIQSVWGNGEREENINKYASHNPLMPGDSFQFYILVSDTHFHIAVNGRQFCKYKFRAPLSDIRTICVTRDVQLINQIDHRSTFPSPYPVIQFDDNKHIFSNDVPKQFIPGHIIVITAIPFGNSKGMFTIRFLERETKKQALHFNARFETNLVVRNSMTDNLEFRRDEERDGGFPFIIDQQFKLAIAMTNNQFKFAVNGTYFGKYNYRNQNQLESLNGFKLVCANGLQLEITGIDHMNIGSNDCVNFEAYSHPDEQIF